METKELFSTYESEVRSYCRNLPAVFTRAKGSKMYDDTGKEYLDFFDGAGALNYGHNNEYIKKQIADYIAGDGITHAVEDGAATGIRAHILVAGASVSA